MVRNIIGFIVFIVLAVIGFIMLSWFLIVAAAIGIVLFIIAAIRAKIIANRMKKAQQAGQHRTTQHGSTPHKPSGKIYDHEDL